jgi:acid phosphatase (class A)
MRKVVLCSAALMCLGVASAAALSEKPYLNAGDADFGSLLPPPPPDGSARDKRDMVTVLELQKEVTPERLAQIQADTEQSVYRFAGEVFGATFTNERFPLAGPFFDKVRVDSGVGVGPIKQAYKRSRPFQANDAVKAPANIAAAYAHREDQRQRGHASLGPPYDNGVRAAAIASANLSASVTGSEHRSPAQTSAAVAP